MAHFGFTRCVVVWGIGIGLAFAGPGTWTSSGPVDLPLVRQVAPHPTDPLRAACWRDFRGVLVTGDGGRTWLPRGRGVDAFDAGCVAWDLLVPDRLWRVGTDLHRSGDAGLTWERVGIAVNWTRSVAILPDPLVRDSLVIISASGPWESVDAGESWSALGTGWPGGEPFAATRAPSNPAVIYVTLRSQRGLAVWRFDRTTGAWTSAAGGLDTCLARDIAVASRDPDIAWLVAACTGQGASLLFTADGGATWTPRTAVPLGSTLAVDLTRDATLWRASWRFGGMEDIYRSDDAGQTWTGAGSGLGAAVLTDIAVSPVTPLVMLASSELGGVHWSVDGGMTWQASGKGLDGAFLNSLESDGADPSTLLATNQSFDSPGGRGLQPLFRSSDAGASWSLLPGPLGEYMWPLAPRVGVAGGFLAASGVTPPSLFRSSDAGDAWQPAAAGLASSFIAAQIVADPFVTGRVFTVDYGGNTVASRGDAYRSLNDAADWTLIWSGAAGVEMERIEADVQRPGRLVATALHVASGMRFTLISRDAGNLWTPGPAIPASMAHVVAVAGTTWYAMGVGQQGLWRLDESIGAWSDISAGLPFTYPDAVPVDLEMERADPSSLVVAISGEGVWRTIDGGLSWCSLNVDPMDHSASAGGLEIDAGPPKTLHLATTGGVWSLTLDSGELLLRLAKAAPDVLLSWSPSALPVRLRRGATPSDLRVITGCATPPQADRVLDDRMLWYYDVGW